MTIRYTVTIVAFLFSEQLIAQGGPLDCTAYAHAPKPPYVLHVKDANGGELVYIGVVHTTDANSPDIAAIEQQWNRIHPTVAFSEGGVWQLAESRELAVSKYGEGGLLRFLAQTAKIPIHSLEPPAADETAALRESFGTEQLKLFYVLREVQQYARMHGTPASDRYIEDVITRVSQERGLSLKPSNIVELEQSLARDLPDLRQWRLVPESWFYPFTSEHFTNAISCKSSLFRDEYMVSVLEKAVQQRERVIAVVGVGHLATQEPLLKSTFGQR